MNTQFPIITIAGGSSSGKSTFVDGFRDAVIVHLDNFYKDVSQLSKDDSGKYNFDEPAAFDLEEAKAATLALSEGKTVTIPTYDYVSAKRIGEEQLEPPKKEDGVIVLEGIFTLCEPLHDLGMLRVFIECPSEVRLARRLRRDLDKGRSYEETMKWFIAVEEGYKKYIEPSKKHANLVVPFSYSTLVFTG